MIQANIAMARRWFEEVWNQKRAETADELVAEDGVCHSPAGTLRGTADFKERVHRGFLSAFPDLRIEVAGTVAEGDQVVVRWMATGTHLGDGMGLPPTGRPIDIRGMTWFRVSDGKFVEGWDCWDFNGLLRSLHEPGPGPA